MNFYTDLIALFLSAIIVVQGRRYNKANIFLGAHFMVTAFVIIVYCFGSKGEPLFLTALLLGSGIPFYFLIGPLAFFYVRSIYTDNAKLSKVDFLHFVPFIIQELLMLPYIFSSWEHKLSVAQIFQNSDTRHLYLNLSLIPDMINVATGLFHVLCYLVFIAFFWWKNRHNFNEKTFNNLPFKFTKRWLILFYFTIIIFLVNNSAYLVSNMFVPSRAVFLSSFPGFIKYASIMHLIILAGLLSFPEIMYGFPRVNAIAVHKDTEPQSEIEIVIAADGKLPGEIILQPKGLKFPEIERQIEKVVHHTKSYLEPDFTIYKLSVEVGIPVHHLRYYFNKNGLTFTNFKNKLRINYAITILSSNERNRYSIEGVGQQAGFTSNASFFTEFKKETGLTPAEYAKKSNNVA